MDSSSSPKIPKAPNQQKLYKQGFQLQSKFLPKFLEQEFGLRTSEDPRRIQHQQQLQNQFGPEQYRQMLEGFKALDPTYFSNREQFGNTLSSNLSGGTPSSNSAQELMKNLQGQYALGSKLGPDQEAEIEKGVRGSQAARGNISGNAAALAEAYAKGSAGLQLQQQRLQNYMGGIGQASQTSQQNIGNMAGYLGLPTMAQQAGGVPPVSPDRSFGYVNPNAGWQMMQAGMSNYQNQLGASALGQQSGGNPWMSAVGGILQTVGPILGSLAFSDRRLKTNIKKVGTAPSGTGVYEYNYLGPRMRGPIAQDVEKHIPGAVMTDPVSRFKMVALRRVDVPMERIA